jgi:hypothetical protein
MQVCSLKGTDPISLMADKLGAWMNLRPFHKGDKLSVGV